MQNRIITNDRIRSYTCLIYTSTNDTVCLRLNSDFRNFKIFWLMKREVYLRVLYLEINNLKIKI